MYIVAEELESQSIRFLTIDDFTSALAMSSSVGELQIKVREMSDKMENLEGLFRERLPNKENFQ